jgi:hypothetical protein
MSVYEKIKEKIISSAGYVKTKVSEMASKVQKFLGDLYDEIVFTPDEDYERLEACEQERIESCLRAIAEVLGENPLNRLMSLSPQERALALCLIVEKTAEYMSIEIDNIILGDFEDINGYYSEANRAIALDIQRLIEEPMTESTAKGVLATVFHELRHAYQHNACKSPALYNMDRATARIWRTNFKNYISPSKNPRRYFNQPVEQDARDFALLVVDCFNS